MRTFKKILVNSYEEATDEALNRVAKARGVRVFAKVRVADVLSIEGSGISNQQYSYALRAHFDFVFADENNVALFAIEFDEPHHFTNPKTIERDQLKNSICDHLGLPLLRIDKAYLDRVGHFTTVLDWIVDMRFVREGFYQAQAEGQLPYDEPFDALSFLETGYQIDGQFVPMNELSDEQSTELLEQGKANITWRWGNPFMDAYTYISHMSSDAKFCTPIRDEYYRHDHDYQSVLSYVTLWKNGRYIYGEARCRLNFAFLEGVNLARELSVIDLARKISQYHKGEDTSCSQNELEIKKSRLKITAN